MINPEFVPDEARVDFNSRNISVSALDMWIGLDCEPDRIGITGSTNFMLASTDISDGLLDRLGRYEVTDDPMILSCYDIADPDFSPPGASQVNIVSLKYGEPWLKVPPESYYDLKYRCAESMLQRVEQVYPGLRSHIEEIEVATPLTFMRYLGHPAGAIYGYEQLTKDSLFFQPGRYSPIKGLFFAGGWTGDCGFEPTLRSGKAAAKSILKQLGLK
jgi:prolycopene isomerase